MTNSLPPNVDGLHSASARVSAAEALFNRIAHGDDDHRAWLKQELVEFFAGLGAAFSKAEGSDDEREMFDLSMVAAGLHRPPPGLSPNSPFLYERDADRYFGWRLCRAALPPLKTTVPEEGLRLLDEAHTVLSELYYKYQLKMGPAASRALSAARGLTTLRGMLAACPPRARPLPVTDVVRVCPDKDVDCGDAPSNWCPSCPKRSPSSPNVERGDRPNFETLRDVVAYVARNGASVALSPTECAAVMKSVKNSLPTPPVSRAVDRQHVDGLSLEQEPKYTVRGGKIFNRASGEAIPDDEPVFIFRARDKQAAYALISYLTVCVDPEHVSAVTKRIQDFCRFENQHPSRMKEPDTQPNPVSSNG